MKIADFAKLEYKIVGFSDDNELYDVIKRKNCNILRRIDFELDNMFKIEYNNSKGEKRYLLCEYCIHDDGCITGYLLKTEVLDDDVVKFIGYTASVWLESKRRGISEEKALEKLIEEEKKGAVI